MSADDRLQEIEGSRLGKRTVSDAELEADQPKRVCRDEHQIEPSQMEQLQRELLEGLQRVNDATDSIRNEPGAPRRRGRPARNDTSTSKRFQLPQGDDFDVVRHQPTAVEELINTTDHVDTKYTSFPNDEIIADVFFEGVEDNTYSFVRTFNSDIVLGGDGERVKQTVFNKIRGKELPMSGFLGSAFQASEAYRCHIQEPNNVQTSNPDDMLPDYTPRAVLHDMLHTTMSNDTLLYLMKSTLTQLLLSIRFRKLFTRNKSMSDTGAVISDEIDVDLDSIPALKQVIYELRNVIELECKLQTNKK